MPVIGRSLALGLLALALGGQGKPPVVAVLSHFATALSQNNGPDAMGDFSRSIPNFGALENNVNSLVAQNDVICSIEIVDESGDEHKRTALTDWFLVITSSAPNGPVERRRERVKITLELQGKKWKITAIDPVSILDPIKLPR